MLSATDDRVGELLTGNSSTATSLGLDPASTLQAVSVFLLIEGEHDEVVVQELIGKELRDLRVTCLAIRGTKALGAASVEMFLQVRNLLGALRATSDSL